MFSFTVFRSATFPMKQHRILNGFFTTTAFLLACCGVAAVRAESILDAVPEDAMAVALVHNLAAADAKITKLTQHFAKAIDSPIPAPLAFAKIATGLGDGIDESGDLLLAALPGEAEPADVRPLLILPIADYAKFAASIAGDATGEICPVKVAGEEVLVAKHGQFALLMNKEHRSALESILALSASDKKSPASLAELAPWIGENEVSMVILPAGVKILADLGKTGIGAQQKQVEQQFADPQFKKLLDQNRQMLQLADEVLGFCGVEIEAAAMGAAIDDSTNARLRSRLLLQKKGELAAMTPAPPCDRSTWLGLADGPYIVAAAARLSPDAGSFYSKTVFRVLKHMKKSYGLDDLEDAQWSKVEAGVKAMVAGVEEVSTIFRVGEQDDPLASNIFSLARGGDAAKLVQAQRDFYELWNRILERSTSDLKDMKYEIADAAIAERKGITVTVDVAAAAADERVPMMAPMWKEMFGEDGKQRTYLLAADARTMLSAVAQETKIEQALKDAAEATDGFVAAKGNATTLALLDPKSSMQALASPAGCVTFIVRLFHSLMGSLMGAVEIPMYPASPPVGFSVQAGEAKISAEMVWPVESLQKLAEYIETCKKK